jgi:hypothetical protein
MPRLEYSERFAEDLARVTSAKVEARIYAALDNIEAFGDFGSKVVPDSIREDFGGGVRKVVVSPFDLVYTYYPSDDLVRIEALVHQRAAR